MLPTERLLGLIAPAVAMVWTPGPNNALLASSGARFGLRSTLPHVLGVAIGFAVMVFLGALGLGGIFHTWPMLAEVLRWLSISTMLWLAWQISTSTTPAEAREGRSASRPWRFHEAAAFQWINPKAWLITTGVVSQFVAGPSLLGQAALCSAVYLVAGLSSAYGWAAFGVTIQRFLKTPFQRRLFNGSMASLIVMTVWGLALADLEQKLA